MKSKNPKTNATIEEYYQELLLKIQNNPNIVTEIEKQYAQTIIELYHQNPKLYIKILTSRKYKEKYRDLL